MLAGAALFAGLGWLSGWAQPAFDLEKVRARAEQADVEAQTLLGSAYSEGQAGLSQDHAEALKWFSRAAEKGFAPAQYQLGLVHELGHGVAADERKAFKFYLMAAEQGFGAAQYNVGNMYAAGRGVGQDLFEANLWFKQAAEKGIVGAQFNLGLAYEAGRGVRKDEGQAARWYKQAADRGFSRAQHNLGQLLEDGRGVRKDEVAAAAYFRAAAEQGLAAGQNAFGRMLAEGRGGLGQDPVQAWVWLSLAVENGSNPVTRDFVARDLSAEQRAAASRQLADRRSGNPPAAPVAATPSVPTGVDTPPARVAELLAALEKAREANSQFAEANQRLELDKARLEQQIASGGDTGTLVEQLRTQSARLAAQVQSLTTDKEAAERQVTVLSVQVRDAQQDLARTQAAASAPAADVTRHEGQVADLTARLEQATASLTQLQAANQQLTEGNARLQQEKEALAAKSVTPAAGGGGQSAILANLQRDNARLNDEVKRSTRELLSLNSQLRALRNQAARPAADDTAGREQIAQLTARAEQAAQDAIRWQTESSRLAARVTELENQPKPRADSSSDAGLAEARQAVGRLQEQVTSLQGEKAELEKWSRSLEQTVNEKSVLADGASANLADLRQRYVAVQQQVEAATAENQALTVRVAQAEQALAAVPAPVKVDTSALDTVRSQLAEAQQLAEKLAQEKQALTDQAAGEHRNSLQAQARVATLERELREASKPAGGSAELEDLKSQRIVSNQLLEKSGTTVAELTGSNDRLAQELAAARQSSAETVTLREELAKLRGQTAALAGLHEENSRLAQAAAEAVALRSSNEQLTRDSEQLTAARTRVAELEKQLAAAGSAGSRDGNDSRKLAADLSEANVTIDRLTATVAELTGANDRLEQDLENAKKSTAAALAAQSQAVNATEPDAYRMEISTLQARVKELEGQLEEDRSSSAREVSTLAAQLTRTRDTNKALTEANRALLSAKQSESPTVDKGEFDAVQARVRELTAAGEELKRQNQKLTADNESLAAERTAFRQQLEEARKVATTLPGITDEKAALQERLEAVGTQLVKAQQEVDTLQKDNADTVAVAASHQAAADAARAELAALQGRTAEAEKASETHNTSVAELTQANTRLEREREDMRRLVESYRADITRLTQNVRSAEQLRGEAERGAQQNIDAVTAQLAQLRRDLETARTAQARLAESSALQDRDRVAIITQLRTENGALAARLNQAQSTLDQIASAARLGTPAAAIATAGAAPVRPVVTAPVAATEGRVHTVTEGDSLSRISMRYYGTANRWQEIFQANRDVLQGSSTLRVGMQLRIP